MSDPIANLTLELACRVGSIANAREAIEDGADINCNGGEPLFLAIINRNREIMNFLIDLGADSERFLSRKRIKELRSREDLVEELIACAPSNPKDVSPEHIEQVHHSITEQGVEFLMAGLDWDKATRFRDSLDAIGASASHRCVAEFLQWARSEHGASREGLDAFFEHHLSTVGEYRLRYLATGEDLVALANTFVADSDN